MGLRTKIDPKLSRLLQKYLTRHHAAQGFAMSVVLGLGLALMILGLTAALVVQSDRRIARQRQQAGASLAVAEGAAERFILELGQQRNSGLFSRNYDSINPRTGKTYFGSDGILNNGDEATTPVDQWAGYNPSTSPCFQEAGVNAPQLDLTGTMGNSSTYTLRAYHYDPHQRQGTLLVEGRYQNQTPVLIAITIAMTPELGSFPGILATAPDPNNPTGTVALRGRVALGQRANIYYPPDSSGNPSVTSSAAPNAPNRSAHLEAIWSGAADDVTGDRIGGTIQACQISTNLAYTPPWGTIDLGKINQNETLMGAPNQIRHFVVDTIELKHDRTLTVDTTHGPVYIYVEKEVELKDTAKILNIRTDGLPPRVGDLRIFMLNPDTGGKDKHSVVLEDTSCIQGAFLYAKGDDLEILTTGPGCPSGRNTNFEGVAWAEMIVATRQSKSARNIPDPKGKIKKSTKKDIPGATSGIYVPDDVSSLADLIPSLSWPVRYRFGGIRQWQQVRL
jgi:hypothetical protein